MLPGGERKLGSATWTDPSSLADRFAYRGGTIWLGRIDDEIPVGYGDDRHVCLVSGSRGGKGTTSIVTNLCLWPGSVVVLDPKGENATITAGRRGAGSDACEGMGQAVHVLDPFEVASVVPGLRSRFNPFDALDPADERSIDEAGRLADALVAPQPDSKDPFWDESARALIKGLILHVLTSDLYDGGRTLVTVRELITRGDYRAVELLEESGTPATMSAQEHLWHGVRRNGAFGGIVAGFGDTFASMLTSAPKQFESVLQVANRNTEFLDSPAMRRCIETSDFTLESLKADPKGVSLYLCLPQRYMNTHYRWLRMVISLTVTEMERVKGRPAAGAPVLMVLDEFAGLKRMEIIETAVAQIAGFGVKLFFVLQSLEQLKATYKDNWETFLSNAGLKLFHSIEDHFTREYVSKLVGEMELVRQTHTLTESETQTEGTSESTSISRSDSESKGRSVTRGTNRSVSRSRNWGRSDSRSMSWGKNAGQSWSGYGFFGRENLHYSGGTNSSASRTVGTSSGGSISETEGVSESESQSFTQGTSRSVGETTGTNRSTSRGQTAGTNETLHKRALISPEEIGLFFRRIDDREHPAFPGLALVLMAGSPPAVVRRTNYFEDPHFIGRFDAPPDHPVPALACTAVRGADLAPFRSIWPQLGFAPVVSFDDSVFDGSVCAIAVDGELDAPDPPRWPLLTPVTGRVIATQTVSSGAAMPDELIEILHYADAPVADSFEALREAAAQAEERRTKLRLEAEAFRSVIAKWMRQREWWFAALVVLGFLLAIAAFSGVPTTGAVTGVLTLAVYPVRRAVKVHKEIAAARGLLAERERALGETPRPVPETGSPWLRPVPITAAGAGLMMLVIAFGGRAPAEPAPQADRPAAQPMSAATAGPTPPPAAPVMPAAVPEPAPVTPELPAPPVPDATLTAAPVAAGPSFDCAAAQTSVERAICGSQSVSALDANLAALYGSTLASASEADRTVIRNGQRAWMATRDACTGSNTVTACLELRYQLRIFELRIAGGESPSRMAIYDCAGAGQRHRFSVVFYDGAQRGVVISGMNRMSFSVYTHAAGRPHYFGQDFTLEERDGRVLIAHGIVNVMECGPVSG